MSAVENIVNSKATDQDSGKVNLSNKNLASNAVAKATASTELVELISSGESFRTESSQRLENIQNISEQEKFERLLIENGYLIFKPFRSFTADKSSIKFKSSDVIFKIDYNSKQIPNPNIIPRTNIELPEISKKLLIQAKRVVKGILELWEGSQQIKRDYKQALTVYSDELEKAKITSSKRNPNDVRYKSTEGKEAALKRLQEIKSKATEHPFGRIYSNHSGISYETFERAFVIVSKELLSQKKLSTEYSNRDDFRALCAYLSVRSDPKKSFRSLPNGLFADSEPEIFLARAKLIGQYFIVHKVKANTTAKVEQEKEWTQKLFKAGLTQLYKTLSIPDLFKLTFPGYLEGANPPIRDWFFSWPNKWNEAADNLSEVKITSEKAIKNVFLSQKGVVKKITVGNQSAYVVDLDCVKEIDWGKIFWSSEYGLRGAIGQANYMKGVIDALNLAVPGIVGGKNGLPLACFKYPGKWQTHNLGALVVELTKYIVERKLKLLNEDGTVSVSKIKAVTDWATQFNEEVSGCLHRAKIKRAYDAISLTYPDLCGWGRDQLKPGDVRYSGMWKGPEGKQLFKLRFASAIYTKFEELKEKNDQDFLDHKVRLTPDSVNEVLNINRKDALLLIDHFMKEGIGWYEFFLENNLTAGYVDVGKNLQNCFEILLGKVNKQTGCFGKSQIQPKDVLQRKSAKSLVHSMLRDVQSEQRQVISINGLTGIRNREGLKTGVENSILETFLNRRPRSDVLEISKALYECFAAAILPSAKETGLGVDRYTILDKILNATYPKDIQGFEGYILTDRRLSHLLKALKTVFIDETNLSDSLKIIFKDLMDQIRATKRPSANPREILIEACKLGRATLDQQNLLNILNNIFEIITSAMIKYETRHSEIYGNFSDNYLRIFNRFKEEDIDQDEELPSDSDLSQIVTIPDSESSTQVDENIIETEDQADLFEENSEALVDLNLVEATAETQQILSGMRLEDSTILKKTAQFLKNGTIADLYKRFGIDAPISLVAIIQQLKTRLNLRSNDRFEYSTLRARSLLTHNIDLIVENDSHGKQINTRLIDSDLFKNIPSWWPISPAGSPLAMPVLFSKGTLYVVLNFYSQPDNVRIKKIISSNLNENVVFLEISNRDSWSELSTIFKANLAFKYENHELKSKWQFMSNEEAQELVRAISYLRML